KRRWRSSGTHPRRAPKVERALLMGPGAIGRARLEPLQLGGELDLVALRVLDHEEEIVAGPVATRAPPERDAQRPHAIGPVADVVPAARLVAVVVGARFGR